MTTSRLLVGDDFTLKNGAFELVEGAQEVAQRVNDALLMYLGEYFLDETKGVPYFQVIFKKPVNLSQVETILKTTITNVQGLEELLTFELSFDSNTRLCSVSFSANTEFNEQITSEVLINNG